MSHKDPSDRPPSRALLKVKQVAQLLNCSERQIWRLIQDNRLPVIRIGRSVRIAPDAVDKLLQELSRNHS